MCTCVCSLTAQRLYFFDDASFRVAHKGQCPNEAPTAKKLGKWGGGVWEQAGNIFNMGYSYT